jgi:nicotinamidase-related amidase
MNQETALLVIDMQAGMFEEGVYEGERLLTVLQGVIAKARAAGVPVIYVQHNEENGLVHGTPAWEVHPAVAPLAGDLTVQKHHPDSFQDTNLQQELESRGIRRLITCGIQTEMCVDTTTRRAYSLGYDVTVVKDAHSTFHTPGLTAEQIIGHHNNTLRWFAAVVPAEEITF